MFLQLSDGSKGIHCVSCKSANRLCYDKVDFTCQGIRHHTFEAISFFGVGCRDTFVRVYPSKLPVLSAFDIIRVIIYLCSIACDLIFMVSADTGITCHPAFLPAVDRSGCEFINGCRNSRYFSLRQFSPRSFLICFMRSLISTFRSGVHFSFIRLRICAFCSSVLGSRFGAGGV